MCKTQSGMSAFNPIVEEYMSQHTMSKLIQNPRFSIISADIRNIPPFREVERNPNIMCHVAVDTHCQTPYSLAIRGNF